jgi:hypothetical protein
MRRRRLLLGVGALGVAGAVGVGSTLVGTVPVRWWATERAALYPGLRQRVESYVERAFESLRLSVDVSFGGLVSFPTENAHRLVVGGAWPKRLLSDGGSKPVNGVNILVTDGSIRQGPSGAGIPYVAAVGGAAQLSRAPPVEETDSTVGRRGPMEAVQILLHECGHALGLRHDHGSIRADDSTAVVSPMVSGYAWAPPAVRRVQFDFEESRCGDPYPSVEDRRFELLLRFDECERDGIHRFRRFGLPVPPPADLSVDDLLDVARSRPWFRCERCLL